MNRTALALALTLAFIAFPFPAAAHALGPNVNVLWVGVLHPVLAIEQGLAILALGVTQSRFDEGLPKWTFPALAAAIVLTYLVTVALPFHGNYVTQALPLLGAGLVLIAPLTPLKRFAPYVIVALAAIIGFEIGLERPLGAQPVMFFCGIGFAIVVLLAYATEFWARLYQSWFEIAVRIAGSWLIAVAVILIGASLRPIA